jgi:Fe-Mn family superoxide dismutase
MSNIELPPLPWAPDALDPVISKTTIDTHYGKHHKAYVDKTKSLIEGTRAAEFNLEEIITEAARNSTQRTLFNNAAQIWNHNRYWESLSPKGGKPSDELAAKLQSDLGGLEKFNEEIVKKGVGHFASGWVWLVLNKGKLAIVDTHDADNALVHGHEALLVLDVWEHAYYVDYKNERERHLKTVVNELLNWDGASERFAKAMK